MALNAWRFTSQLTGQRCDFVAGDRETMVHQEQIGQTSFVEGAVNPHGDNRLAIALDYFHSTQREIDGEDFVIGPFFDRSDAAELPTHVFGDGIRSEAG